MYQSKRFPAKWLDDHSPYSYLEETFLEVGCFKLPFSGFPFVEWLSLAHGDGLHGKLLKKTPLILCNVSCLAKSFPGSSYTCIYCDDSSNDLLRPQTAQLHHLSHPLAFMSIVLTQLTFFFEICFLCSENSNMKQIVN